MLIQSKETRPVKSIPKDFSEANPSKEIKPVKSIPKDFSDANSVKRDKTS